MYHFEIPEINYKNKSDSLHLGLLQAVLELNNQDSKTHIIGSKAVIKTSNATLLTNHGTIIEITETKEERTIPTQDEIDKLVMKVTKQRDCQFRNIALCPNCKDRGCER